MTEQLGWLNESLADFDTATALASQIGVQSHTHEELLHDTAGLQTDALRTLTENHLREEQMTTFALLVETSAQTPYEKIGEREVEVEAALAAITLQLTRVDEMVQPQIDALRVDQQRLVERLPALASKTSVVVDQSIEALIREAQGPLRAQREHLELQRLELDTLYEQHGAAWPIPRLIHAAKRRAIVSENKTSEQHEQGDSWESEFREALDAALDQLDEWQLLVGPEVVWSLVGQRSPSAKVGTITMMQLALDQGIVSVQTGREGKKAVVPTARVACMLIQDSAIFRKAIDSKARRKQALALADELVAARLAAKNSRA